MIMAVFFRRLLVGAVPEPPLHRNPKDTQYAGAVGLTVPAISASSPRSPLPLSASRPSGEKATDVTACPCSQGWPTSRRVAVSHKRTLRSSEPVRAYLPSGEKATASTGPR